MSHWKIMIPFTPFTCKKLLYMKQIHILYTEIKMNSNKSSTPMTLQHKNNS